MSLFKTYMEEYDETVKYGFKLAIQWAELAQKYDKDPIEFMKEHLNEWGKP